MGVNTPPTCMQRWGAALGQFDKNKPVELHNLISDSDSDSDLFI